MIQIVSSTQEAPGNRASCSTQANVRHIISQRRQVMNTLLSTGRRRVSALLSGLALLSTVFWGGPVFAVGTVSGTSVNNLATLSFSVAGIPQANIGSSATGNTSGAGTATTFVVDNKVNLTVVETDTAVTTSGPGTTQQVTTFTVTNTGNTPQGYTLAALNQGVTSNIAGVTDSIDVTLTNVFVESGATPGYQAAEDTATFIQTLANDITRTVYVLATIPNAAASGSQANITLTATTKSAGLANAAAAAAENFVQSTVADTAGVDIVFADAATVENNFVGASAARDAQGTARDAYRVASALISVAKTSLLLCDPSNGIANQKHIPGAIVRWTITITNAATATASATLTTVADTLNVNTLFDANLVTPTNATTCSSAPPGVPTNATGRGFSIDVTGDGRAPADASFPQTFLTTVGDGDGATTVGNAVTIDYVQALPADATGANTYAAGELKPGESVIVFFNVTIQ